MANALSRVYDLLVADPRSSSNPNRHHQLHGKLATRRYDGRTLECWQHEISGSGRAWFLIDDKNPNRKTVWIIHVGEGHPAATD